MINKLVKNATLVGLAFALLGCNSEMVTELNATDIGNSASNGKVLKGFMSVEMSGGCYDSSTGAESDNLVKADGVMYNLFGKHQDWLSCEENDDYGFSSTAHYSYDITLDTIIDGKTPNPEIPVTVVTEKWSDGSYAIKMLVNEKFKSRLNSRMGELDMMELKMFVNITNDTKSEISYTGYGVYFWDASTYKYQPMQYVHFPSKEGTTSYLKMGSVATDTLLNRGVMVLGHVTFK